jgi:hypothetical protein
VRRRDRLQGVVAGCGQRRDREQGLAGDPEGLPAGRQDADVGRLLEDPFTHGGDGGQDVLAVVEEEQAGASREVASHLGGHIPLGAGPNAE